MRQLHNGAAVSGQSVSELIVAVQARDFFDDIDLALHITPPAGNVHAELRVSLAFRDERESQPLEQAENLSSLELAAKDAVNFGNAQQHRRLIHSLRDHIDNIAGQFSAPGVENHFGDQVAGEHGGFEIGSALEAVRSVGMQAVTA